MNNTEVRICASFRRQSAFLIIICGCLFLLSSLAIKPLYIFLNSDIVWCDTLIIPFLETILELCEIFAYSVGFSSVIYSRAFGEKKRTGIIMAEFMVLAILRRTLDIIMTIVIYGSVDSFDIKSVLFALFMELVQLLAIYFISNRLLTKGLDASLPFKKIYSKKNALQVSALWAGGILSAVKIVSRIIYDVDYGAPQSVIEVLSMILFYSLDILVAVIAYTIIIVVLSKLHGVKIIEKP